MAFITSSPECRGSDFTYFGLEEEHIQGFEGIDFEQLVPDLENIVPTLDVQTLYENNSSKQLSSHRKGDKFPEEPNRIYNPRLSEVIEYISDHFNDTESTCSGEYQKLSQQFNLHIFISL